VQLQEQPVILQQVAICAPVPPGTAVHPAAAPVADAWAVTAASQQLFIPQQIEQLQLRVEHLQLRVEQLEQEIATMRRTTEWQ
jgi:hypothetical protein